jgi:hypothetical protein
VKIFLDNFFEIGRRQNYVVKAWTINRCDIRGYPPRADWIQNESTGRRDGLSNVAQLPAGRLARRGLFERRDDRFYMGYTLALRRHEAHRQKGINTITPIGQRQPMT